MSPKQFLDMLRITLYAETESGIKPAFSVCGQPGCGKTSVIHQAAADLKVNHVDIRLNQHNFADLKFPIVKQAEEIVKWVNSIFPKDPKWRGIIALDEFDKCGHDMQGSALQLIWERRLGDYVLPDDARVVLLMNEAKHRAGSMSIISPVWGRCINMDMEPATPEEWNEWAIGAGIDFRVRMYILKVKPGALAQFDPNAKACPTPRNWEKASFIRQAYANVKTSKAVEESSMFWPLAGCVGQAEAAGFLAYCKIADVIPDVDNDILAKPLTAPIPKNEPSLMWAICGVITDRVKNKDPKIMASAVTYANRLPDDLAVMLMQDMMVSTGREIAKIKETTEWVRKHRNVLTDAK